MSGREHHYEITMRWTGNTGKGTANYREYGRDHDLVAAGKPVIHASADPAFRGQPERWNPEELLVASLADCHMLTFLALCSLERIVVTAYEDTATGTMTQDGNGGRFTEVPRAGGAGTALWSTSCAFVDMDRDGFLDLFVTNYVDASPTDNKFCGRRALSAGAGQGSMEIRGYCHPLAYGPLPNVLYRNTGKGAFEDVSAKAGIAVTDASITLKRSIRSAINSVLVARFE